MKEAVLTPSYDDTLHAKLREATKNLHRRLDHHPLLAPLMQPGLDQRRYGNALLALYGVHAPLEDALAAFFNQRPGKFDYFDYASRSKASALKADLAQLGRPPIPITVPAHAIGSLAESVGVLYPLEGSMLGAQVILRQLQLQTKSGSDLPVRFFSCYGDQAHVHWRSFLAWADIHCPAAQHDVAIAAAQRVFNTIADHLDNTAQHLNG
ncbi:MAG: biliverdin-producing heme oxygenase [Rhodoferax sp.]|nr:biliverdin-producing heme oxygenase [Rhodoferax sp.]